ncbi:hypothetical protein FHS31_000879 [Sphingomonas vulcanisoli]|uniref:Uncharacterized protein n=1 Tax=Sphingomonas vulcanisoli TaxID=1658060 RepID=A0ABX0TP20_9SPHN|nr:hypothetical protein [Sphingomonas vulcanisoli]NIJ07283.1 hypothetical protein [Sphingomonas vulcanisoli]
MEIGQIDGHALVAEVRKAARAHGDTWEALVPPHLAINLDAEEAEEAAYAEMAQAKRRLRDHICEMYGISMRELSSLAQP